MKPIKENLNAIKEIEDIQFVGNHGDDKIKFDRLEEIIADKTNYFFRVRALAYKRMGEGMGLNDTLHITKNALLNLKEPFVQTVEKEMNKYLIENTI